ncbi:hypothetical protein HDU90_008912 [Geranomyces variabilis]|nr:hypothetical protein HDU90_008912 [Geranomyces variabilis]
MLLSGYRGLGNNTSQQKLPSAPHDEMRQGPVLSESDGPLSDIQLQQNSIPGGSTHMSEDTMHPQNALLGGPAGPSGLAHGLEDRSALTELGGLQLALLVPHQTRVKQKFYKTYNEFQALKLLEQEQGNQALAYKFSDVGKNILELPKQH